MAVAAVSCLTWCAVTACSSGSGGSSGASAPGVNGHTVEIGISGILSTPAAATARYNDDGLIAYLKWVNSQGGVNGYKFSWTEKDNANSSSQSAAVARQLAPTSFALYSAGTQSILGVQPIADNLKIPIIAAGEGDLFTPHPNQYMFATSPPYSSLSNQMAKFAMTKLGATKIGLAYQQGLNTGQTLPPFVKSQGGQVVASVDVDPTTTDYTPYAEKLKASGATAVITMMEGTFLAPLQKAAAAIGYHPKWVGWFLLDDPTYRSIAGSYANGTYYDEYNIVPSSSNPVAVQYRQIAGKYYPSIVLSDHTVQGWDAGAVIAMAVRKATAGGKPLTRQGFLGALDAIKGEPAGLIASLTYNDTQHYGADAGGFFLVTPTGSTQVQEYQDLSQYGTG
jgi:ABC-type branched-subunit amino acid transport system substrate-binding protein